MRMILEVQMPHEPFNTLLRQGTAAKTLAGILDTLKPEAVYFTERDGKRGAVIVLNVEEPSRIPSIAEPFFLSFNADCRFGIAMSPEDLRNAGLEGLAKRWG
ncbi:MAG: panthothenate synthetase [Bryobacteraceae bacterium]|nr:panthothenate synthetase [Bryobacteraceae bacterium]